MHDVLTAFIGNPVLFGIAVVLSILILLAFAKRIVRLVLVLFAIAVLYAGWLLLKGDDVVDKAEKAGRTATEAVDKGERAVKLVDSLRRIGRMPGHK